MKLKEIDINDRPRERLLRLGAEFLSDAELLAIILVNATRHKNVLSFSQEILSKFNFYELSSKTVHQLMKINGIGISKACQIKALFEISRRSTKIRDLPKKEFQIKKAKDVYNYFKDKLIEKKQEHVLLLTLNTRNVIISTNTLFIGSLNESIIHPREIFKQLVIDSARSFILVHNHPSGDFKPSNEDEVITKKISEIANLVNIKFLDHIIIAENGYFSFREDDLLD